MKKLVFILIIGLISCDDSVSPISEKSGLTGSWIWLKSTGGIDGRTETPLSTGESILIEITNSRFKKYVNGSLTEDFEYSIGQGQSIYQTEEAQIITLGNGWKQSFSVDESSLVLKDECYDCFQHEFKRDNQD